MIIRTLIMPATFALSMALCGPAGAEIRTAYLWADQPTTASYEPNIRYRSATAGTARIQRSGTGRYSVDLNGFLPLLPLLPTGASAGHNGTIHVSAYGDTGYSCRIVQWSSRIDVACFNTRGKPVDSKFSLLAVIANPGDNAAYAWAGRPSVARYIADRAFALNAVGGDVEVHRTRVGEYIVGLGVSIATVGGNVQVSAYGPEPRRCQLVRWHVGQVNVRCRDASGHLADSAFTVLAIKASAGSREFAYAWSNKPVPAATVDPRYVFAPEAVGGVGVSRLSPGRYSVRLGARLQNIQVTAYGNDGAYCNPVGWSGTHATVACHSATGAAVDSRFSILAVNGSGPFIPPIVLDPDSFPPLRPPVRLFGYVDLHTHPASFMGFGGREDGRQGMMWGRPAVGAMRSVSARERYSQCYADDHSEMSSDETNPDNFVKQELRKLIIGIADERTNAPHTANGANGFPDWPHSLIVTHQQIDVAWLRRAHQGGLRAIVAAAVDNEVIDVAYDWNFSALLPIARDFFAGRSLRAALGIPRSGFALESARQQLRFLRQMVNENCNFMELAFSGADARRIVVAGKLAVVLGLELDTLSPEDIRALIDEEGVRFVTPIHFVDNEVGSAAAYETMFSLLSGVVGSRAQPYDLVNDSNVDFRIGREFGAIQDQVNELTRSALGWSPIGEACEETARTGDRLGCVGKRNAHGLTPAGESLAQRLLARGIMVDTAHMSEASQERTLAIAESACKPVFNSHTGMRSDSFVPGATERAMPARLARRLLDLGGVIGVGTGVGELNDPRRIYYNAGNPLIDFRNGRDRWTLDLRQPELQQTFPEGRFRNYRITLRIGSDNVEPANTVTASLLSRTGVLGVCVVVPRGAGTSNHSIVIQSCSLPAPGALLSDVDGLKLEHTAENSISPDNVNIDEVILEIDGDAATGGWRTMLQRTGGHESEVVRLKAPGPAGDPAFGSHYWVTRLLPRASELTGRITGLRVRTFTNEDDLGGSAPGLVRVSLSGHRESSRAQALVFAEGGAPAGTFTDRTLRFLSGGEGQIGRFDRAPGLSFGAVTLAAGGEESTMWLDAIVRLRHMAEHGTFLQPEVQQLLGFGAAALGTAVVGTAGAVGGWAIADPLTATLSALVVAGIIESHDNWSSLVAIDAVIEGAGGRAAREVPFLVGYNPMQRIKRAQPVSTLFRDLPERIESSRLYAGLVANFTLTTQEHVDWVDGGAMTMDVLFSDGTVVRRGLPTGYHMPIGKELRIAIPFDKLREGRELVRFRINASSPVLIRSLDLGLMKDPATSFAEAFAQFDGLGRHSGQIGFGSDLSGFEALVPFSTLNPGFDETLVPPECRGTVVAGECQEVPTIMPAERPPDMRPYEIDIERTAGRPDPARAIAARGVPSRLGIARVDDTDPATRLLDFRLTGLSTIGQLPELAVTAAQADRLERRASATLGPDIFTSVDSFVRAWEALDAGARDVPVRPPGRSICP